MTFSDICKSLHLSSKSFLVAVCVFFIALMLLLFWLFKPAASVDFKSEIQTITASVRTHFQKNVDYRGLDTAYVINQHIVPKEFVRAGKLFSKNNAEILIGKDTKGSTVSIFEKTFGITYLNLNQKKCIQLLLSDFSSESGLTGIFVSNDNFYELSYGGNLSLPVSEQAAQSYCKNKNTVMLIFE